MDDDDQFFERLTRNVLEIDAQIHHQFAFDPDGTHQLRFAYFGGMYDDGAAWQLAPNGTLTLPDNTATIYIERGLATGLVSFNLIGFTYGAIAPIAMVTTANGEVVDVLDRRPHDTGAGGGGGGGGCTTFVCLTGTILDAQVPSSAVTQHNADLDHGLLEPVSLTHDDHLQYLLLAGRAGGQVANGGLAASELLTLRGSADAGLGLIRVESPINIDVDWNDTSPGVDYLINWQTTVLSSGGIIEQMIYMRPTITVDSGLFIVSAIRDLSEIEWTVNPTFSVSTLLFAQSRYITRTAAVRPGNYITYSSQPYLSNQGAGAGITGIVGTALQYAPIMEATLNGDQITATSLTGLAVSPLWSTVSGTTINFGTVRGVWCKQPAKGTFFPGAGVETMVAYYGLSFDNITFGGATIPKVVVYSLLAPATNSWFLYNQGTGGVGADSYFGFSDILFEDAHGFVLGSGQDIRIEWAGIRLRFLPASGAALQWEFNANEVIWRSLLFGFDTNEMLFGFHKFAFGQITPVGNHIGTFVAATRVTSLAGEWSDFHLAQAGNLTINHAMSNVAAWLLAPLGLTAGTGSIAGYVSTFVIQGMTTSGLGGQPTHAFHQTGRRTLRGVDAHEPLSPAALAANVNDYSPATGNSMRQVWRIDTDGSGPYNITGIAVQQSADTQWITNVHATDSILLQHQNAGSVAANRIISPTGADLTLGPNESALLWYDSTTTRWRILYTTGA